MDGQIQYVNLDYLDDISGGDANFKKELIGIFLTQIPEFIRNLYEYFEHGKLEDLAKEAHTAKSSVLIFNMEQTGANLKKIQLLSENNQTEKIPTIILQVEKDLKNAVKELTVYLKELEVMNKV